MTVEVHAKTDIGLSRKTNEDSFLADPEGGLFALADGMGGHAVGEIASRLAIDQLRREVSTSADPDPLRKLLSGIASANQAVIRASRTHSHWQGMGTTLSAILVDHLELCLAHVGDSRIYRFRDSSLEQLSDDHTLAAERLRFGNNDSSPTGASTLGKLLLQGIGITPTTELNICHARMPLAGGDLFLLCSDGLSDMLPDKEIRDLLRHHPELSNCAEQLIQHALNRGGKDNVTVLLVRVT